MKIYSFVFLAQLLVIVYSSSLNSRKMKLRQDSSTESGAVETQTTIVPQKVVGEEVPLVDAFCFINTNGTVYDLNDLKSDNADYKIKTISGYIDFNICRNALNPCADKTGMASYTRTITGENCVQIAGNSSVSSSFYKVEDTARNITVLRMKMPEGDVCQSDNSKRYVTEMDLTCDESAEAPVFSNSPININSCTNTIFVATKSACPKYNVYAMWNRMIENKWIFGLIIIGLGIFFCFFGEEFIKISQILAGGAVALVLFMYLIFNNTEITMYSWQFWLIIVLALVIGCLAGYFMSLITWLPGVVFGGLLGFVLGLVLYNLFLRFIQSNPATIFWITMIACIVGGCIFGYFFEESICIISTSICGAYAIIRGLSIIAGGFPDERQVYELGQKGEWDQMKKLLDAAVYGYLAGFIILAIAGMYVQFKYFYDGDKKKKKDDKEKEDKEKNDDEKVNLKEE